MWRHLWGVVLAVQLLYSLLHVGKHVVWLQHLPAPAQVSGEWRCETVANAWEFVDKRTSIVEGNGLFARETLPAGQCIFLLADKEPTTTMQDGYFWAQQPMCKISRVIGAVTIDGYRWIKAFLQPSQLIEILGECLLERNYAN